MAQDAVSQRLGVGRAGRSWIAQRPSLAPRPPTSFHCCAHTPILVETPARALEEEQIWASWLPHSLQQPGFLIDGDYYIIDLLDRSVPTLGTLCPSKPALRPGTCRTEPAARSAGVPSTTSVPGRETPQAPSLVGLGGRRTGSRAGAPQVSLSASVVWLYQR